jgi:hypothetical protein
MLTLSGAGRGFADSMKSYGPGCIVCGWPGMKEEGGASANADNNHQFASALAIVDTADRDASGLDGPDGGDRRAVVRFKCSRRIRRIDCALS